ncbi:amino-acid N-acetyltransferase [Thiohalobacter sp. IOR34]|uniref:amino-acid N-acetyltransferase n=1 Tax=Thiohalobacter sp. IOR34 TaxID=3057176 RepID=UPI0025B25F30|nr:amino-acid N-acetyltransferase [Thiohalobacter sp. IOR34]WJW75171.1 amino-acid N-acetyltransferase [Thiohalobacter sp. IOR34]
MPKKKNPSCSFVDAIRHAAPYIHAHRGRTFVIGFSGEAVEDPGFATLVHDIGLLHSLGVRLVLVHGARPQIERRLKESGTELKYAQGLRITDDRALAGVKQAVGSVRVEVEAQLSMGLAATPMAGAQLGVASGNFVTARPLGVRDGIDYQHTGEVRRIDAPAIREQLGIGRVVLLSPLGYSPTGEVFNLHAEEVATAAAIELKADKLILLVEGRGLTDGRRRLIRQLTPPGAQAILRGRRVLSEDMRRHLESAVLASRRGVRRCHLIGRQSDGALLSELFTRDGVGTLITAETYEGLRQAGIDDVGGILELIEPLEQEGVLVRRSRERLEMEIDRFFVVERDGLIIACAALYPDGHGFGELACLAVHPDYRGQGRGDQLLEAIERHARQQGIDRLFVLTTRTSHWFQERGFRRADVRELPVKRRSLYNYQRNSRVLIKPLQ